MAEDFDPEWIMVHDGDMPADNRAVTVLVALKGGKFVPDIGRYYGKEGWDLQVWGEAPVIAWCNIPDFVDHTKIVDVEDAA
jgi:hypothetical protein